MIVLEFEKIEDLTKMTSAIVAFFNFVKFGKSNINYWIATLWYSMYVSMIWREGDIGFMSMKQQPSNLKIKTLRQASIKYT